MRHRGLEPEPAEASARTILAFAGGPLDQPDGSRPADAVIGVGHGAAGAQKEGARWKNCAPAFAAAGTWKARSTSRRSLTGSRKGRTRRSIIQPVLSLAWLIVAIQPFGALPGLGSGAGRRRGALAQGVEISAGRTATGGPTRST
jgi:hypothetical protein